MEIEIRGAKHLLSDFRDLSEVNQLISNIPSGSRVGIEFIDKELKHFKEIYESREFKEHGLEGSETKLRRLLEDGKIYFGDRYFRPDKSIIGKLMQKSRLRYAFNFEKRKLYLDGLMPSIRFWFAVYTELKSRGCVVRGIDSKTALQKINSFRNSSKRKNKLKSNQLVNIPRENNFARSLLKQGLEYCLVGELHINNLKRILTRKKIKVRAVHYPKLALMSRLVSAKLFGFSRTRYKLRQKINRRKRNK